MQIWMFVCVAVLALTAADPVPLQCTIPPSQGTLNDLTGSKLYLKYTNIDVFYQNLLSFVYSFTKSEEAKNEYSLHISLLKVDGQHVNGSGYPWTEYPSQQKLQMNENLMVFYSLPYLKKNETAVLYFCHPQEDGPIKEFVMVLTTNLDNDLSKALKAAKKLVKNEIGQLSLSQKDKL